MFFHGGFPISNFMTLFGLGGTQPQIGGGSDVVYHSRYFYVMCCECGDNDGYRC